VAITLVQSRSIAGLTLDFSSNVTTGNLLVVVAADINVLVPGFTISDSQGNSYTSLARIDNAAGPSASQLFFAVANATGANTVTITDSSGSPQLAIHEISGVSTIDQNTSATGIGNAQDSGPVTTTTAAEFLLGYSVDILVSGLTLSVGVGWSQAEKLGIAFITEFQVVAATGTFNATTSTTVGKNGTNHWIAQIVTFKPGATPSATAVDYWLGGRKSDTKIILPGYTQ
jgi:hypothetical protein